MEDDLKKKMEDDLKKKKKKKDNLKNKKNDYSYMTFLNIQGVPKRMGI
jgi:hypothetical protein